MILAIVRQKLTFRLDFILCLAQNKNVILKH